MPSSFVRRTTTMFAASLMRGEHPEGAALARKVALTLATDLEVGKLEVNSLGEPIDEGSGGKPAKLVPSKEGILVYVDDRQVMTSNFGKPPAQIPVTLWNGASKLCVALATPLADDEREVAVEFARIMLIDSHVTIDGGRGKLAAAIDSARALLAELGPREPEVTSPIL